MVATSLARVWVRFWLRLVLPLTSARKLLFQPDVIDHVPEPTVALL